MYENDCLEKLKKCRIKEPEIPKNTGKKFGWNFIINYLSRQA